MKMRAVPILLISAALAASAVVAAVKLSPASTSFSGRDWARSRPGPDSGRVALMLDALGRTDPVVCELIGDQMGNFWSGNGRYGVGRLAAASNTVLAAKDSIGGAITDERAIRRLIAELDGTNACTRRIAAKMLGGSSIDATRVAGLLTHASANVRESAALAAGTGDHELVLPALHRGLEDRAPAVAAMSAWAIGQIEDASSVAPLLAVVRGGGDTRVRIAAVWALGQIEDARAVPDVIIALRDPDAGVRAMSAEVLGDIEDDVGVAPLERALGADSDARVRAAAATSLGQLSSATSAGALGRALADADVEVRRAAAESLGELDDVRVAPPGLVAALSSPDAELRYRAAKALCEIADPATTAELVGLLSNVDAELRKEAVEALGEIGTPAAVQGITRALGDKDAEVRKAAVEALGDIKEG